MAKAQTKPSRKEGKEMEDMSFYFILKKENVGYT
jgi:hypothetical protein